MRMAEVTGERKPVGLDVRVKAAAITLAVALIAFPLTFVVWPPSMPASAPAAAHVLGYVLLAAECLVMGAGVAFLVFGFPAARRLPVSAGLAFAAYLGISYFLVNWWTHDHLHAVADTLNFNNFIWMTAGIEYVFHVGMMVFGAVLALFFARLLLARPVQGSAGRLSFRWKFAIIAVVIALVSIPTSLILFKPNLPGGAAIPTSVLPLLVGLKLFEGLALGTGIGFLIFGYPLLKRAGQASGLTLLAFLSIAWFLVNWWPHDNLHLINGFNNIWGLLAIEFGFHITLMLAAVVLAFFFYRVIRQRPEVLRSE